MSKLAVRIVLGGACSALLMGCAAQSAKSPPSSAASEPPQAQAGYGQPAAYPSTPAQPAPLPEASPPPPPPPPPSTPGQPGGAASGATSRSMAVQGAANEVDSSQRELDLAAGDCRNACRALGSMDRAAGRLCELSQGSDEGRRCDDAKRRVYSARDRVKTTCGTCPNGPSVERRDPIPSLR